VVRQLHAAQHSGMVFRRKLLVLEKAHQLFVDINKVVPGIRQSHHQPLKRQLVKSALSTSSNLAEGRTKHSEREFLRFLDIALGSAGELQYQLKAAIDCSAIARDEGSDLAKRAEEVAKMIQGLMRRIKQDLNEKAEPTAS
jgi:four helix bundle protein